jgi:hypothetical protein
MLEVVDEAQIARTLALEVEVLEKMLDGGGLAGAGKADHEDVETGTGDLQAHLQRRQRPRLSDDLRLAVQFGRRAEAE